MKLCEVIQLSEIKKIMLTYIIINDEQYKK